MTYQSESIIILITWTVLLVLFLLNRYFLKNRFIDQSLIITISHKKRQDYRPGTPLTRMGVLFVFLTNITTFFLIFFGSFSPVNNKLLEFLHINFPSWIRFLASVFFILNSIWGLLILMFNPNYTPLTKSMGNKFLLATHGPYALIRHPRYMGEAWLNIILFLFTGIWISLLGILGWVAIYYQAIAEEKLLIILADEKYEKYRRQTGMFFPRLRKTI